MIISNQFKGLRICGVECVTILNNMEPDKGYGIDNKSRAAPEKN